MASFVFASFSWRKPSNSLIRFASAAQYVDVSVDRKSLVLEMTQMSRGVQGFCFDFFPGIENELNSFCVVHTRRPYRDGNTGPALLVEFEIRMSVMSSNMRRAKLLRAVM